MLRARKSRLVPKIFVVRICSRICFVYYLGVFESLKLTSISAKWAATLLHGRDLLFTLACFMVSQ